MKKNNAGFTIIELLVVIAIIAVLAAIVLINVTRYIDKGKDSAAMGDLGTLFTNAITFYNETGAFDGVKTDPDYQKVVAGLESDKMNYKVLEDNLVSTCNVSVDCTDPADSEWCVAINLKTTDNTAYCVDSSGNKKEYSGTATAACSGGVCQ